MQQLHEQYSAAGLRVVGFPCNQFGGQEPGTPAEIRKFVTDKFGVSFLMTEKIDVNGDGAHDIFSFLKNNAAATSMMPGAFIKWNFTKFLVSADGTTIDRFEPQTAASDLSPRIEELLANVEA